MKYLQLSHEYRSCRWLWTESEACSRHIRLAKYYMYIQNHQNTYVDIVVDIY